MSGLPIREDDRTMGVLRKRVVTSKRRSKRQVPADIESGDESGDDTTPSPPGSPTTADPKPTLLPNPTAEATDIEDVTTLPQLQPQPQPTTSAAPPPPVQLPPRLTSTSSTLVFIPITTESSSSSSSSTKTKTSTTERTSTQTSSQPTTFVTSSSVSSPFPISSSLSSSTSSSTRQTRTTATASTPVFSLPEAIESGERPVAERTRAHTSLSHGATIALEVIGIFTGVALLIGVAFLFYRRLKRKRQQNLGEQLGSHPPSPTATTFGFSNRFEDNSASSFAGRVTKLRNYLTPASSSRYDDKDLPQPASSVVGRAQRLDLVKPELLSEKHKNGTFMKGHQRSVTQESRNISLAPPNMDFANNQNLFTPAGSEVPAPRKAFLQRNTIGKLVIGSRPFSQNRSGEEDETPLTAPENANYAANNADAKTNVYSRSGPVPFVKTADGRTKPLTGWRRKLFWPGSKSGSKTSTEVATNDPTLMSGGLRVSGRGVGAQGLNLQDGSDESGVFGNMGDARHGGAVVNSNGAGASLGALEGLRRGDALVERGVDRQSFVSGMLEGSRTTWGTNVWERLDRERELRESREKMEGGLGGEVQLNGRESSVARYRRPVSWIQDQVERHPEVPQLPDYLKGVQKDVETARK